MGIDFSHMNWVSRGIAAVLALVMVMTAGAMAVARGQTYDAAGFIIICDLHGVRAVAVDQDGTPVEAPHFCPDCVLGFADHAESGPVPGPMGDLCATVLLPSCVEARSSAPNQPYFVRGPPV